MVDSVSCITARWLSRAWTLCWGCVVLATGLLLAGKVEAAHWSQVVSIALPGWLALNAFEKWKGTPE